MLNNEGDHTKNEIEIKDEIAVFKNKSSNIFGDKIIFPSEKEDEYLRFYRNIPYSVAVLGITKDKKAVLIKNLEHGDRNWRLSVPTRFGALGTTYRDTALKELKESIGGVVGKIYRLKEVQEFGYKTHIYIAEDVIIEEQDPGDGEIILGACLFTQNEARELIKTNKIVHPITLYLLQHFIYEMK